MVNTARGEIVDQAALAAVLVVGHPMLNLSPIAADRLLLKPHIAGTTLPSFRRMLAASVTNIARALRGEQPHNVVNAAAIKKS